MGSFNYFNWNVNVIMKFEEINKLFNPKEWDVGVINREETMKCANSPLKVHYQSPGLKYNYVTKDNWEQYKSVLVVIRFTPDPGIYDFYYEVSEILKGVGEWKHIKSQDEIPGDRGWRHLYFDFKKAAVFAGLGVRAKNSLIHNRKFAFNCKICAVGFKEEITRYKKEIDFDILKACIGCDDCLRNCPVDAIKHDGLKEKGHWIDSMACDNHLEGQLKDEWRKTQKPLMSDYEFDSVTMDDIIWDKDGFNYDPMIQQVYKDKKPYSIPYCTICIDQPRCTFRQKLLEKALKENE